MVRHVFDPPPTAAFEPLRPEVEAARQTMREALRGSGGFAVSAEAARQLPPEVQARLSQAEATAQANADAFNRRMARGSPSRWQTFSMEFSRLQSGRLKKLEALKNLRRLASQFSAEALPHSACQKRCAHCCHIPVAVCTTEARLIGKAIGKSPENLTDSTWLRNKPYGYSFPCTFLTASGCSIYEHRPLSCRVHLNLDRDDLLCRLIPDKTVPVPLANATSFQLLYAKLTEGELLADIREHFPATNGLPR